MEIEQLGEFGLIARLQQRIEERRLPQPGAAGVRVPLLVGIGDDAAAWQGANLTEIWTTDTMVEGVHFTRASAWRDVGWKAMVSNQSDAAAMGATPLYALVTLGLPPGTRVEDIDALYDGMLDACAAHGGVIVGGDIVRSPVFFVTIGLTGATPNPLLLRSTARPGDAIAVTGNLGGAEGGLRLVLNKLEFMPDVAEALTTAHVRRTPRVKDGRILAEEGVRCAMDISDGLVDDLGKLCTASGVAAVIRAPDVPVHPALHVAFPQQATEFALMSGEEYELVFTAPPAVMGRVLPLLPAGATVIGHIVSGQPGRVRVEDANGQAIALPRGGWDHFRP
jgi:thiamine-monophosphate kinase